MTIAAAIEAKLTAGLQPLCNHSRPIPPPRRPFWRPPEGETHFRVEIVADVFAGQSRVARQRQVYALLADEFDAGLHALSIRANHPG